MSVLFMTLGTGVKGNEESLAHGLTRSVIHFEPKKIVFFGSEESKKMINLIIRCYQEEKKKEFPEFEFILLENVDDFDDCFEKIKTKIEEYEVKYKNEEIVIDYTSGTKTMTISAAIVSFLYHKKLNFVKGKRVDGIVIKGTEVNVEQNLYQAYDKLLLDEAKRMFNNYRFEHAIETLNKIVFHEEKERYRKIFEAYRMWDRFRHSEAFDILKEIRDERLNENRAFLGKLSNAENKKMKYILILADLINNAERRVEEGKYDDAAARLYRAVEFISQIKLLEFGIDDVGEGIKLEFLQGRVDIQRYSAYHEKELRKVLIGIRKKFDLLGELGWSQSQDYYKRFQNHLRKRNDSILAHGINPVDRVDAEMFLREVKGVFIELFDVEKYLEESKFVKL